jgi:hypothetical protein
MNIIGLISQFMKLTLHLIYLSWGKAPDMHSEVLGSNFGRVTVYPDLSFSLFSLVPGNRRIVPRLGFNRFLPNPFQFIIRLSSYYMTPYSHGTESAFKYSMKKETHFPLKSCFLIYTESV